MNTINRVRALISVTLGLALFPAVIPVRAQGTWSAKAPMPTKRSAQVAALNGKIYAVGGQVDGSTTVLPTVEAYDPVTNSWATKSPMPTARLALGVAAAYGKLFAIGGCTTNDCRGLVSTVEAYDPVADTWTTKAPMPTARRSFAIGIIDGVIYVTGGLQGPGSSGINVTEAYDPVTDTWSTKSPMPTPRGGLASAVSNGQLYALGGYNGSSTSYIAVEAYNPSTDAWVSKAALPVVGAGPAAALNDRIYSVGISQGTEVLAYDPRANVWSIEASVPVQGPTSVVVLNGVLYAVADLFTEVANQAFTPSRTPTWTPTGSMNTARYGATGTLLSDGRFLVAGGSDSAGNFLSSAEIFNPATGTWTLTSPMVQPQGGAVAVLLHDGRMLVYGGNIAGGPGGVTTLAQIFDPTTGLWSATGSMNQPRQSFIGTLLANGQAMAVGGYYFGYLNSAELYNPNTGTWSFTGSLPGPVAGPSATLLPNGKVLVTGGTTGFSVTTAELYDPTSGTWSLTGSLNQARSWGGSSNGTILLNGGQVLAAGGAGGSGCGSFLSSAELYNPISGTWAFTGSLSTALAEFPLVALSDGRVLVAGGLATDCSTYLNTAQIYDPSSGAWSPTASLNQARSQHAATRLLDGTVLVAGGYNGSTSLNSTEIFSFQPSLGGTSTTLAISPSSPAYGQSVTLTATVTPSSGTGTPTGTVTFYDGAGVLGTAPLGGGQATLTISSLTAGAHSFSAVYSGDSNLSGGTSAALPQGVSQATLTITANSASRAYGSANPAFTFNSSGLVNGDTLASVGVAATCSSTATTGSPAGSYAITCSGPSSTVNYTINYQPGTLTVTQVPLTIAANNATKILDAPNSAFTATYSGFVNGDTPASLTGTLNCTSTAATTSPVGSYPISCSGQSSNNYTITYAPGTLKILYASGGICAGSAGHQILPPINADGSSVFKQGRKVPAQFRVCDANGVSIGTAGVVSTFFLTGIITGTVTNSVEDVVDTNNPDTAFRWDAGNLQWIFNISTQNLSAGSTYLYTISLNDGTSILFQYGLK